jgi:hypothetical protein
MSFDFLNLRLYQTVEWVEQMKRAAATPNPFAVKQADIGALQQEIGELRLHIAVLYRLLLTKDLITEAEIHDLISSLDLADGKPDGQFDGDPVSGISVAMHPAEEPTYPEIRTT